MSYGYDDPQELQLFGVRWLGNFESFNRIMEQVYELSDYMTYCVADEALKQGTFNVNDDHVRALLWQEVRKREEMHRNLYRAVLKMVREEQQR